MQGPAPRNGPLDLRQYDKCHPAFVVVKDCGEGAAGALNSLEKVIGIQELLRGIVRAMG